MEKKVKDLIAGETFSMKSRKNAKRYTLSTTAKDPLMVIKPPEFRNPPEHQIGKMLVILKGCGQLILDPEHQVIIHGTC